MDKKHTDNQKNVQRKQMIAFITRVIQNLDDVKLRNIYYFVLNIK